MKTIVYIGNKSNSAGKSNLSSIDVLSPLMEDIGFAVHSASNEKNILFRFIHMLFTCFKYRKKADFVLIDTYSTLNFYYAYFVSQLCRILNLKYIPILHGGNLPDRLKNSPKLSKSIFENAFVNIAPSKYMKSQFEVFGISKIVYIPNALQLNNYEFKKFEFKGKIKLLWVRSFSKIYNPILAIKVLKSLKDEGFDVELCMVGPDSDGSLEQAKTYAKAKGVEVSFTGKLTKHEWISLSTQYNIFINTTNFDNMPVSVLEAMALGLPVVTTNVGGLPFLIEDKKNGVLVNPNSVEEFVKTIKFLFESPESTKVLAGNARKYVEQFDWKNVKDLWIEVLK